MKKLFPYIIILLSLMLLAKYAYSFYFLYVEEISDDVRIENIQINENPRLIEETDDYVIYERDFKADEFSYFYSYNKYCICVFLTFIPIFS